MPTPPLPYQRVLLKLSGEALAGQHPSGIDPLILDRITKEVIAVHALGCSLALVIGGGNIFRGGTAIGIDRTQADYMGMLATLINSLALQAELEKHQVQTRVMSALPINPVAEPYIKRRAVRHLEKGRIVLFAAGTGNPYCTTDTAASLRALGIGANVLLKATKVDGIYDADPHQVPTAKRYETLDYLDILNQNLRVMDATAISLCMENRLPVLVFNLFEEGAIQRAVMGHRVGTLVSAPASSSHGRLAA